MLSTRSIAPIVGALTIFLSSACGAQQPMFDTGKWAQGHGVVEGESPRSGMVVDAMHAGVKPGASRQFIRGLLGAPDGVGPHADNYELGYQQSAPESAYLRIQYNGQDIATNVDVISR